jgi:cell division protein FtsB
VTVVLVVDALVGERGLVETMRARRLAYAQAERLAALKRENQRLRQEATRLNGDLSTIEGVARKELGLIRPGEVLVIVKDARPAREPRRP